MSYSLYPCVFSGGILYVGVVLVSLTLAMLLSRFLSVSCSSYLSWRSSPKSLPASLSHSALEFFSFYLLPFSLLCLLNWPQDKIFRTVSVESGRQTQTGLNQQKSDIFDSHNRNTGLASGTAGLRDLTNVSRTHYLPSFHSAFLWLASIRLSVETYVVQVSNHRLCLEFRDLWTHLSLTSEQKSFTFGHSVYLWTQYVWSGEWRVVIDLDPNHTPPPSLPRGMESGRALLPEDKRIDYGAQKLQRSIMKVCILHFLFCWFLLRW